MRRTDLRASLLAAVAVLVPLAASGQGMVGSRHDFSSTGWGWAFMSGPNDEICLPCHTPHSALAVTEAPLWNHEVTSATFAVYTRTTVDALIGQPNGTSKMCLSCHDGTVALDSWGGQAGTVYWPTGHRDVMGTDLTDDHPISFAYDAAFAAADGRLRDPTVAPSGLGGTITSDLLNAGNLECSSCHDVHDDAGLPKLLRMANGTSALCLTCHVK